MKSFFLFCNKYDSRIQMTIAIMTGVYDFSLKRILRVENICQETARNRKFLSNNVINNLELLTCNDLVIVYIYTKTQLTSVTFNNNKRLQNVFILTSLSRYQYFYGISLSKSLCQLLIFSFTLHYME